MGGDGGNRPLAELVAGALEGRADAWDEIVRRYSHQVRLALLARGVALDAVDDLVQEAWMRLVRQQRAGRLRSLEIPGLAIAQAGWLALEAQRTARRRAALAQLGPAPAVEIAAVADTGTDADPAAVALRHERALLVRRALAGCTPREREVFGAAYGREARAHADVARAMGLSVQRVRQLLCNARARVRRALADREQVDRDSENDA
jgi:RNA polymerase sigma-70 factor (ECF subfamily)